MNLRKLAEECEAIAENDELLARRIAETLAFYQGDNPEIEMRLHVADLLKLEAQTLRTTAAHMRQ